MTFLTSWNELIMANTYLATDDLRTLPFSIIRFEGQYSSDDAVQFARMVIVALPARALYLAFSKRIIAGATLRSPRPPAGRAVPRRVRCDRRIVRRQQAGRIQGADTGDRKHVRADERPSKSRT
jgi:hypothetical protein